jgi:hypothetical protein
MTASIRAIALAAALVVTPAAAQITNLPNSNGSSGTTATAGPAPPGGVQSYGTQSNIQSYGTPSTATSSSGGRTSSSSGGGGRAPGGAPSGRGSSSGGAAAASSVGAGTVTGSPSLSLSATPPTSVSRPSTNWLVCPTGGPPGGIESAILGGHLSCAP